MPHDMSWPTGPADFRTPSQRIEEGARQMLRDIFGSDRGRLVARDEKPSTPVLHLAERRYDVADEPAKEHIANALQLLTDAAYFEQSSIGANLIALPRADYDAIVARLSKALTVLRKDRP